jgi:hypothetical protein
MTKTLHLAPEDAVLYRQWARWMLGLEPATSPMAFADELYRRHGGEIRRVARALADIILPLAWGSTSRELYRGLRLEEPGLHRRLLPPHRAYGNLPALSFSGDPDVACYFADPAEHGMPALPIPNAVTGKPGLPDHGYIAIATIQVEDVLFHWRFAIGVPDLFDANGAELDTILAQREVTIQSTAVRTPRLQALEHFGPAYLTVRYPRAAPRNEEP